MPDAADEREARVVFSRDSDVLRDRTYAAVGNEALTAAVVDLAEGDTDLTLASTIAAGRGMEAQAIEAVSIVLRL